MKLHNKSTSNAIINDIKDPNTGEGIVVNAGVTVILYNEDTERSADIKAYIASGILEITGNEEPAEGVGEYFVADDTQHLLNFSYDLAILPPARPVATYANLFNINDGGGSSLPLVGCMTGGAAQKTYAVSVNANRPSTAVATGDSNDAIVKGAYNNHAANDANYIIRGINMGLNNRSGGVIGMMDNLLGNQNKSGGTVSSIIGLTLVPENYGTVSAELTGLKIQLKNEGAVPTHEYGIKIENLDNSTANKAHAGIYMSKTGTNTGFVTGIDLSGLSGAITNEIVMSNGNTLTVSGDNIVITNSGATKSLTLTMISGGASIPVDSTLVHNTGNESIAGIKSFSTQILCTGAAAGYLTPCLGIGIYGTPLADAAVIDNIFATVNISSGVNKTNPDTSAMALFVGNRTTAAVINNKMQGVLSSMTIAHNVFDAYAGQFHIAITDTMITNAGNANLVGLACKANIATSKTATGNVSALYCVLDSGAGTVITGTYDVIRIENNAAGCNSAINFGATANMAYLFGMATGGCVAASTTTTISADGYSIKVKINGEDCYIRCAKTA